MTFRVLALALALWSTACERTVPSREAAVDEAAAVELESDLRVEVEGGLIVPCPKPVLDAAADAPDPLVCVRASRFDTEVLIIDSGCAPRPVRLHVTNTAPGAAVTWRAFRADESTARQATRSCCGALLAPAGDPRHPTWTPLGPEHDVPETLQRGCSLERGLCWRSTSRPGTDEARLEAWTDPNAFDAPKVACAELGEVEGGPVRAAPFVLAHRIVAAPAPTGSADARTLNFAVIGNTGEDYDALEALVARVGVAVEQDAVRFVLVSGDVAPNGARRSLERARQLLDALPVPWFATAGDKDVDGADPDLLVGLLGPPTEAFEVQIDEAWRMRVVLLDAAEGGLSARSFSRLPGYLDPGEPPGPVAVVLHVPPFDPAGLRGAGFKRRAEAARLVAALDRSGVATVFSGHLSTSSTQRLGDLEVVHGGARHFLLVRVNEAGQMTVERPD
jgi:hypothetical protein